MIRRIHRWLATPAGVVSIAIAAVLATLWLLGVDDALRLTGILAAVAAVDVAYGVWGRRTFSAGVNWEWHHRRWRYWVWAVIMAVLLVVGLHAHFTGV